MRHHLYTEVAPRRRANFRLANQPGIMSFVAQARFPVLVRDERTTRAGLPVALGPSREAYVAIGTYTTSLRSSLTHPALCRGQRFLSETQ